MPARVALVSGSSRGLGAVIARRLARDGLVVAVNGLHDDDELAAVVARSVPTVAWLRPSPPMSPTAPQWKHSPLR